MLQFFLEICRQNRYVKHVAWLCPSSSWLLSNTTKLLINLSDQEQILVELFFSLKFSFQLIANFFFLFTKEIRNQLLTTKRVRPVGFEDLKATTCIFSYLRPSYWKEVCFFYCLFDAIFLNIWVYSVYKVCFIFIFCV